MKNIIVVRFIINNYIVSIIIRVVIGMLPKTEGPISTVKMLLILLLMLCPSIIAFILERKILPEVARKYQLTFNMIN